MAQGCDGKNRQGNQTTIGHFRVAKFIGLVVENQSEMRALGRSCSENGPGIQPDARAAGEGGGEAQRRARAVRYGHLFVEEGGDDAAGLPFSGADESVGVAARE